MGDGVVVVDVVDGVDDELVVEEADVAAEAGVVEVDGVESAEVFLSPVFVPPPLSLVVPDGGLSLSE